jgi:hypothetical protein
LDKNYGNSKNLNAFDRKCDIHRAMDTREAGRRGGIARAKKLTPEQRKAISAKAVAARWKKYRLKKVES